MIKVDDLRAENKEVLDLCEVLGALIEHADLRNNPVFCELLARLADRVKVHLSHEDQSLYSTLLTHSDKKIRDTANHFMGNTRELKRIFASYAKQWCHPSPDAHEHEAFMKETRDIFRFLRDRVRLENEELFPVMAQLGG